MEAVILGLQSRKDLVVISGERVGQHGDTEVNERDSFVSSFVSSIVAMAVQQVHRGMEGGRHYWREA